MRCAGRESYARRYGTLYIIIKKWKKVVGAGVEGEKWEATLIIIKAGKTKDSVARRKNSVQKEIDSNFSRVF